MTTTQRKAAAVCFPRLVGASPRARQKPRKKEQRAGARAEKEGGFRFDSSCRDGVTTKTCFDAVVAGERPSTTRFGSDSPSQFRAWRYLNVGNVVRIWSGP